VIRCHDNSLENDVIMDAAALAARQSKCTGAVIKVSLTRCRDVKKPPGAKPGLVQLTGKVRSISVNMKKEESRLNRIDTTMVGNG
jgi:predicted ribosome quality control (RQC) complex YloA/Tae2 family protein